MSRSRVVRLPESSGDDVQFAHMLTLMAIPMTITGRSAPENYERPRAANVGGEHEPTADCSRRVHQSIH